jgi:hypothetical protein
MDSSDLFSHPYEPQIVEKRATSSDSSLMPAFSDQDQKKSPKSTPSA